VASSGGLEAYGATKDVLPSGSGMDAVSPSAASERCVLAASEVVSRDVMCGIGSKSMPWSGTRFPGIVVLTARDLFSNTNASKLILL
jgi:hypothetical protein